ncbi:GNAT family N-acetyltransferase [uncultured Nocardioides sp.]|uniref:GNAT family N-acetyltransferase n=1 Tax=uncultured Nocardioides sp. TaxID=198441 RepID=UPI0026255DAF|nr:GNAT family N-acetyltransferase [uncultured Nocardioides sp.]
MTGCRPAVPADLPALAEVFLASRAAAAPAMPPVPAAAVPHVRRDIASWDLDRREVWVAVEGQDVVGFAAVVDDWLEALYVAPDAQRAGVGSMLLEVVTALRPRGFCLWVFTDNAPARAFYAAHGLLELEHTDGSANPERTPDLRMVWPGADPVGTLRRLVDDVDHELGDLLQRRVALTRVIQDLKTDTARDPGREADVVRRVAARAPALGEDRVARVMAVLIAESLDAAASRTASHAGSHGPPDPLSAVPGSLGPLA